MTGSRPASFLVGLVGFPFSGRVSGAFSLDLGLSPPPAFLLLLFFLSLILFIFEIGSHRVSLVAWSSQRSLVSASQILSLKE